MRLEQITAKALSKVKNDRYILSLAVAKRAKELEKGATTTLNIDPKGYKSADFALMEIAEGAIRIEGLVEIF
ncbi:MAG: DNA-directed RNA polymerase subunit omega [Sulfuricurvum sp. PC08-66]|nr:MAG: DNA-directed RNA polymerase subunit omega [Sulfuricurvum sp. PC08-66]